MNRKDCRRAEAQQRRMGATTDKGFEQYRALLRQAYSKSSDREIGEGWMRGEAAAVSGVDGMFIHPTGEAPPTPRNDDIRLSANYGQQSFKARTAANYLQNWSTSGRTSCANRAKPESSFRPPAMNVTMRANSSSR